MKRQSYALKRRARRRGTVMYFVAGGLVMLMGAAALAVDYGVLVNDKNYLQRVCDAAALAGATKLPETDGATNFARMTATQNRFTDDANNDMAITFLDADRRIQVEAVRRRSLFFARVLGQNQGVVRAHAIASAGGPATPQLVPIVITTTTYDTYAPGGNPRQVGEEVTISLIRHNKEPFVLDNFMLTDLRSVDNNAKSPAHMESQLEGEEQVNVQLGTRSDPLDYLEGLNASGTPQKSFFSDGMRTRFTAAAGAPWFDVDPQGGSDKLNWLGQHYDQARLGQEPIGPAPFVRNPRIMDLIVTNPIPNPAGGNTNTPVLDFAPVYAKKVFVDSGGTLKMTLLFLPKSASAGGGNPSLIE